MTVFHSIIAFGNFWDMSLKENKKSDTQIYFTFKALNCFK